MSKNASYKYDAYLSFSPTDEAWVEEHLLPRLSAAGARVYVPRSMPVGRFKVENIETAVEQSRNVILIMTPNWVAEGWNQFQVLLVQSSDPAATLGRTIPVLVEPCEIPVRIRHLETADLTHSDRRDSEFERIVGAVRPPKSRIFISYKHSAKPDAALAKQIYAQLKEARYTVFIDEEIKIGQDWAKQIEQRIEDSDYMIVLLSELSVQSEMMIKEIEHAHRYYQDNSKPKLLPVRVNYTSVLPYPLNTYLYKIQYAKWRSRTADNTVRLMSQLLDAIAFDDELPETRATDVSSVLSTSSSSNTGETPSASGAFSPGNLLTPPQPYADPSFIASLVNPGGAVPSAGGIYIERDADHILQRELSKEHGVTITIQAPRQSGKSSLLIRGLKQAEYQGGKSVFIDLQPLDNRYTQDIDQFFRHIALEIFYGLNLDTNIVERIWERNIPATNKIAHLLQNEVFPYVSGKITLGMDELDRLLDTPIRNNVFGSLRSWYNNRAINSIWNRLNIITVISTEPYLLITDPNQSPFNVGLRMFLSDFDHRQIFALNERYRHPLPDARLADLLDLLGGHPYLTSKALYTMLTESIDWDRLVKSAILHRGPFGDHLKRYWWLLRDDEALVRALRSVLVDGRCEDDRSYHRLNRAGLLKGDDSRSCEFRCKLYEQYFRSKLL